MKNIKEEEINNVNEVLPNAFVDNKLGCEIYHNGHLDFGGHFLIKHL